MNREKSVEVIRNSELAAHADELIPQLLPSARLLRENASADDVPIGASRMGGDPDLPAGFGWPFRKRLDCLLQIRLSDVPRHLVPEECPERGMLWFFYDAVGQPWSNDGRDADGTRVLYHPSEDDLRRTPPPRPERHRSNRRRVASPCRVRIHEEWTLPEGPEIEEVGDLDAFFERHHALSARLADGDQDPEHRLFGHPKSIQGEVIDYATTAGWDRLHLLQLDSDDRRGSSPGWMWGDGGRLYFVIRRDDLAARDFTNVEMALQCY